jgi:acyl-CoA thioester hydrolase
MFASMGLTPAYLKQHDLGIVATRQNIAYRRELRPGDLITIRSAILEIHPRQIRFYHEMSNDETGEVAAATLITGLMIHTQTRRPHEFPPEIVERGREMLVAVQPLV